VDYYESIERILKSNSINWKIKDKLRSGKNYTTCDYGNAGWCFYIMKNPPYYHHPDLFNHLMICNNYICE
jgi:hypothetical protein